MVLSFELFESLGLLSLIKLGLTPGKKSSRKGWNPTISKTKTSSSNGLSGTISNIATNAVKEIAFSYSEAVARKDRASTATVSPSSSLSPQSGSDATVLTCWPKAIDSEIISMEDQDKSPILSLASLPPQTLPFSPGDTTTTRRCLFRRQQSLSSLAEITMSPLYFNRGEDIDQDASIQDFGSSDISYDFSYDHYDYDLNHDYDFDLDEDLATERSRYLKCKRVHIDGVEITAEEQEFTKSFNRIKLNRRPRRANRRKPKHFSHPRKSNEIDD